MRVRAGMSALVVVVLLAACTNPSSTPPTSSAGPQRLEVYEALIRRLARPESEQPIYVLSDLCFQLMTPNVRCPDRLTTEEQQQLGQRLRDLGRVVFRSKNE